MIKKIIFILILFSQSSYALEVSELSPGKSISLINMNEVFSILFSLSGVIFFIFLFSFIYKKLNNFVATGQVDMKIISSISVGTKEKVTLLRIGEESYLIGVAQGNVSLLSKMSIDFETLDEKQEGGFFSEKLQQALNKEL